MVERGVGQGGAQQFAADELHAVERRTVQREVREIVPFETDVAQLCAVQPAVGEGHVAEEAVVPESVLGGERVLGEGSGTSKQGAQQEAARDALNRMEAVSGN